MYFLKLRIVEYFIYKTENKTKKLTVIYIYKSVKIFFGNLKIYKGCNILIEGVNSNCQSKMHFKNLIFE